MQHDMQPTAIPCYAVDSADFADALAGRLLERAAGRQPNTGDQDPFYRNGFAAGVCWAQEVATLEDLDQLAAASRQGCYVAASWLRGFIDGAVAARRDTPNAEPPA